MFVVILRSVKCKTKRYVAVKLRPAKKVDNDWCGHVALCKQVVDVHILRQEPPELSRSNVVPVRSEQKQLTLIELVVLKRLIFLGGILHSIHCTVDELTRVHGSYVVFCIEYRVHDTSPESEQY